MRCGDVSMAEYAADALNGHASIEAHDGEGVACAVEGNVLADAAGFEHEWYVFSQGSIADGGEELFTVGGIAVDNVDGSW